MEEVKEEGRNDDEDHDIELANRTTNMTKRKKLWIIYWKRKRLFENACYIGTMMIEEEKEEHQEEEEEEETGE